MKQFFCLMTFAFFTSNVYSWGSDGHKIVAQIAEDQLSPNAKTHLLTLLDGQSLSSVANWADSIKSNSQWAHTKPWHFVDIADGEDYHQEHSHPEGDVISAISDMVKVLKNSSASIEEQKNAAKFIIHFVGDIHQPLHVGRPDDRGGNNIKVIFNGKNMNLHSLWDSAMITLQKMDYLSYARSLQGQKFLSASYDITEFPFSTVVLEDLQSRKNIYDFKVEGNQVVKLDKAYMDKNLITMNSRLLYGGQRLAGLFNSIYK